MNIENKIQDTSLHQYSNCFRIVRFTILPADSSGVGVGSSGVVDAHAGS